MTPTAAGAENRALERAAESTGASCRASDARDRFRVASYPLKNPGNPYVGLFYSALAPHGVDLTCKLEFSPEWLARNAGQIDALHIHWPERIWRGRPKGRLDRWRRAITRGGPRAVVKLEKFLRSAGDLGIKRIWTVHNLEHHEGGDRLDQSGYDVLAAHSDMLITHSRWAAEQVRARYPHANQIVPIRRGTYAGVYPTPRPRAEVLAELGLNPELPVVSCVGILRRYKGVEVAREAIDRLGDGYQLLVAGKSRPATDARYWQDVIGGTPRTRLIDRELSDQEFADVISASDAVLQPYHKITGSGLLFAAWTFGRGVIASDLPFFREMFDGFPHAGVLCQSASAERLAESIRGYLAISEADRAAGVQRAAEAHDWSRSIGPVAQVFSAWQAERSGRS